MVFPDCPEWLEEEVVDWRSEEEVGDAVEKFLGRVSVLFPVQDEFWDVELEDVEWRLWEIPVLPMGYDLYDEDWEDIKEPAAFLLYMSHNAGAPVRHDDFAAHYPNHLVPRNLEPALLVDVLRQFFAERFSDGKPSQHSADYQSHLEPLSALPDLIEMLNQNTGNAWLDIGEMSLAEGGGYPVWSRENVEWLADEWQQAKPVLEGVHRLLDWQNETPEEVSDKLTAVREALLEAYYRNQEKTEPPEPEVRS